MSQKKPDPWFKVSIAGDQWVVLGALTAVAFMLGYAVGSIVYGG